MANECIMWYCVRLDAQANLDGWRWLHNMHDKNMFTYMHSYIKLQPLSYVVSNITHTSACHHWLLLKLAEKKVATIVYVDKTGIVEMSLQTAQHVFDAARWSWMWEITTEKRKREKKENVQSSKASRKKHVSHCSSLERREAGECDNCLFEQCTKFSASLASTSSKCT